MLSRRGGWQHRRAEDRKTETQVGGKNNNNLKRGMVLTFQEESEEEMGNGLDVERGSDEQ